MDSASTPNESSHAITFRREVGSEDLKRNFPTQFCVLGQIHFTHSTRSKLGNYAVMRERRIGGYRFAQVSWASVLGLDYVPWG